MRSTQDWGDVRYREYTSSVRRMERFKSIAPIHFTDSGHKIIPHVAEHKVGAKRMPRNQTLGRYVASAMAGAKEKRA